MVASMVSRDFVGITSGRGGGEELAHKVVPTHAIEAFSFLDLARRVKEVSPLCLGELLSLFVRRR
jgi:hypothetical protein